MIRVFLVEDDPDWVDAIRWLIEKNNDFVLVGSVTSENEALELMRYIEVDVVLVDVMLDEKERGIDLIPRFKERWPHAKVVMLSSMEDGDIIWESFASGATNYIVKTSYNELPDAIRDAYANKSTIHSSAADFVRHQISKFHQERIRNLLTTQERRILLLVNQGKTTTQIQDALGIELQTLQNHIANINKKLQSKNRKEAVEIAKSLGILA